MSHWDNCSKISRLENYFHQISPTGRVFAFGGEEYYFDLKCEQDYLKAFNSCPPLKSIIGKRSKAFNTGKMEILNKNTGNFAVGGLARSFKNILSKPNILQTGFQFFAQHNHYIDIFGYCPILIMRPTGLPDEISAIWNIPPWLFDIEYTGKWLKQNSIKQIYKAYYMYWNGEKIDLDYDNLHFVFDDGIGTEMDTNLTIPDSRLVGNEYSVSNIIAAYKSRNTLITKRGAVGILSNDSKDQAGIVPLKQDQKDTVQKDFQKYGIVGQPYQVIITDAALKWQQMGFPTKDLMLFEEIEDDINRLCDAYGWPSELISRGKDVTFDNKKEATKAVYRDTIIPESDSRMEQMANAILPEDANITISRDYSDIEVLQEDNKSKAEARAALNNALKIEYDAGLITKNDWLEELGRDRNTDPAFDQYKTQSTNEGFTPEDQEPETES